MLSPLRAAVGGRKWSKSRLIMKVLCLHGNGRRGKWRAAPFVWDLGKNIGSRVMTVPGKGWRLGGLSRDFIFRGKLPSQLSSEGGDNNYRVTTSVLCSLEQRRVLAPWKVINWVITIISSAMVCARSSQCSPPSANAT